MWKSRLISTGTDWNCDSKIPHGLTNDIQSLITHFQWRGDDTKCKRKSLQGLGFQDFGFLLSRDDVFNVTLRSDVETQICCYDISLVK